jgi:type III pantothenate kinase
MNVQPVDALLVLDVGNTRIGMALWTDDGLHDVLRVSVADDSEWGEAVASLWNKIPPAATRAVVMSSVAPRSAARLADLVLDRCDMEPVRVRDDIPLPMEADIESLEEVGVDRICSAAAAFDRLHTACAVASFGTAITIDCVSAEGRFMGGAILPGLEMSLDALHEGTAALPHVDAEAPTGAIGRNTHDAIVNGVVYGAVGAMREIVERYAMELGHWPQLVLTGGNAALVREVADFVDSVVPDLCLMGTALAYRRVAGQE